MFDSMPHDPTSGFWDDGDWISWDDIEEYRHDYEIREAFPKSSVPLVRNFESLVDAAIEYRSLTGRYLQIWGELGEFYAEIKFGIQRHRPHVPGSDGKLGNDFVEVKTISPEKAGDVVGVKRSGNFSKLLVVRITDDWRFEARMINRRDLGKGTGKLAKVKWAASGTNPPES
jgi:hypothetical protein